MFATFKGHWNFVSMVFLEGRVGTVFLLLFSENELGQIANFHLLEMCVALRSM